MHFRQHVPGYVDGVDPADFDFAGKEGLLAHPEVARWTQDDYTGKGPFSGFALSRHGEETLLMATYDEGLHWWVVGYLTDAAGLDLPAWMPNQKGAT